MFLHQCSFFFSFQLQWRRWSVSVIRSLHPMFLYHLSCVCLTVFLNKFMSLSKNKTKQKSFIRPPPLTLAIILSLFHSFTVNFSSLSNFKLLFTPQALIKPASFPIILSKPVPLTKLTNNLQIATFNGQFLIWSSLSEVWDTVRHSTLTFGKHCGLYGTIPTRFSFNWLTIPSFPPCSVATSSSTQH